MLPCNLTVHNGGGYPRVRFVQPSEETNSIRREYFNRFACSVLKTEYTVITVHKVLTVYSDNGTYSVNNVYWQAV
jgi:hypothetical protein